MANFNSLNHDLATTLLTLNKGLFSTILIWSSLVSAGTMGENTTAIDHGLYLGISGGGTFSTATSHASSTSNLNFPEANNVVFNTNTFSNLETSLKQNAGIGSLFMGYGLNYKKIYLGAEIFANISNYQMHESASAISTQSFSNQSQAYQAHNNWQINTKVSPFQYGLDLRPGFFIQNSLMLFGRVGFAVAKLTQSSALTGPIIYEITSNSTYIGDRYPFQTNLSSGSNKIALRLGGGFEYYVNPNWSLRMDYINVNYGSAHSNTVLNSPVIGNPLFVGTGTLNVTGNVNVKTFTTNTIMIGVSRYIA